MSNTLFQPTENSENVSVSTSQQEAVSNDSIDVVSNMASKSDDRPAYLDYKPETFAASDRNAQCYRTYLDKLGFKEETYTKNIRLNFVRELRAHVCAPETMYMRKEDNPAAFAALIRGFLQKYGRKYWGTDRTARNHLEITDISRGFLYPRDANREESRFMAGLEELFQYKAKCARNNDVHRDEDKKIVPYINFAIVNPGDVSGLTPRGSQGMSTIGAMRELKKIAVEAEEPVSADDDSDAILVNPATGKRQQDSGRSTRSNPQHDNTVTAVDETADKRSGPKQGIFKPKNKNRPSEPNRSHKKIVRTSVIAPGSATPATANDPSAKRLKIRNDSSIQNIASTTDTPSNNIRTRAAAARAQAETDDIQAHEHNTVATVDQTTASRLDVQTEPLSIEITSKTVLMVSASSQQDMAPVTVKLDTYTGSGFFKFLAEECELGHLAKKVTAISATYMWDMRKHRIRRERMDVDWATFCDRLRQAFDKNPDFFKYGCEVELLLHVAA